MKNKQLLLAVLFFLIGTKSFAQIPKLSANKDFYCSGETATLTVTGCSSGILWSNGATSSTIQVSIGKYYVSCLYNNGQQKFRDSLQIPTVKPFPLISQKGNICINNPNIKATFYVQNCKGASIIQWIYYPNLGTPTLIASGIDSIQTNKQGGYYSICQFSCSPTDTANYGSNMIFLNDDSLPPTISGGENICNNDKATLIATGCGNNIVIWSNGATTNSISVGEGIYSAACQNNCGKSTNSNQIIIQKSFSPAAPVITPSSASICNNDKATLQASCITGSLLWSNLTTSNTISVGAGTYSAICQNACGSSPYSNTVTIIAGATPNSPTITSDYTTLCNNGTAILTAKNCSYDVQWSSKIYSKTSISVSQAGNYFASCVNACGSSPASNTIQISACANCKTICPPISVKKISKKGL